MDAALADSTREALRTPWILDCDTTIKPLYGHQDGAEVSYNPQKPGRPSHPIHTYWIGNVHLVLDAEVQSGKAHAARHSLPRLRKLLEDLPPEDRPRLVRGDCAFGNENAIGEMEDLDQAYLFKLRQSAGVKRLIERQWSREDWQNAGQGFEAVEAQLKLSGWSRARRVVVLRRVVKGDLVGDAKATSKRDKRQQSLQFADLHQPVKIWEYAVLATNVDYDLEAIGQLYRDRDDCENGFDELKNQWGWGATLPRTWSAAISRPVRWRSSTTGGAGMSVGLIRRPVSKQSPAAPYCLAGVARLTQHAGQSRLLLTLTHAAGDQIKRMVANVRAGLDHVRSSAPQLPNPARWTALVRYIVAKIISAKSQNHPPHHSCLKCRRSRPGSGGI